MYVNLGVGMPTLAPAFMEPGSVIHMQSENGILGQSPRFLAFSPSSHRAHNLSIQYRDGTLPNEGAS